MSQELRKKLNDAINQIEKMEAQLATSKPYSEEIEKLRMMIELIKEQVGHENISNSTR